MNILVRKILKLPTTIVQKGSFIYFFLVLGRIVAYTVWDIRFDLGALPILPDFHQHKENWAGSRTEQSRTNQASNLLCHPVHSSTDLKWPAEQKWPTGCDMWWKVWLHNSPSLDNDIVQYKCFWKVEVEEEKKKRKLYPSLPRDVCPNSCFPLSCFFHRRNPQAEVTQIAF